MLGEGLEPACPVGVREGFAAGHFFDVGFWVVLCVVLVNTPVVEVEVEVGR